MVRQPNSFNATTSTGTSSPPTARPVDINPSAVARRRSNHFTTAVVSVMNPARLAPTEMMKNEIRNTAGESN